MRTKLTVKQLRKLETRRLIKLREPMYPVPGKRKTYLLK